MSLGTSEHLLKSRPVRGRSDLSHAGLQDQDDTNYAVSPSTPLLSTAIEENGWVSGKHTVGRLLKSWSDLHLSSLIVSMRAAIHALSQVVNDQAQLMSCCCLTIFGFSPTAIAEKCFALTSTCCRPKQHWTTRGRWHCRCARTPSSAGDSPQPPASFLSSMRNSCQQSLSSWGTKTFVTSGPFGLAQST